LPDAKNAPRIPDTERARLPDTEKAAQLSLFDQQPAVKAAALAPAGHAAPGAPAVPRTEAKKAPVDPVFLAWRVRENPFPGASTLQELQQQMAGCRRCVLHEHRTTIVFGEGNPKARLMLVGEGPGANEDATGRPFVGAAGQLLDRILWAAGFAREEVYIANVVKCRPPGNRLPEPSEAAACFPCLLAQMRLIKPSLIVCLGALATQTLVDSRARITKVRGEWYEKAGMRILSTFHPAALLRDPSKKKPVWEDFKKVREAHDLGYARQDGEPGNR
jgi:DNA polymerase